VNDVAVRAHNVNSNLVAFEVAAPGASVPACLATAVKAWPEYSCWLWAAFERGDFAQRSGATWFFQGEAGEALAD
jgi:hypothetical protein